MKDIVVFVGSLRKDSWSRKVAKALALVAPENLKFEIVEIGNLPLYNEDLDTPERVPAEWTYFRERTRKADGFLIVSPEYNRSIPGALKNALDVASRPGGHNTLGGRPAAVVTVSPYNVSAALANHHIRQTASFLNMYMMAQPEAYYGNIADSFNTDGTMQEYARERFTSFMGAFDAWIGYFDS